MLLQKYDPCVQLKYFYYKEKIQYRHFALNTDELDAIQVELRPIRSV